MNSVFSAFKTNKNDKQKNSLIGSKKINNIQDNSSYENLRHIREIGSSTKMMTSIVNDDVDEDLLNLHKRPIIKTTVLSDNDCYQTSDVVDHAIPPTLNNSNLLDNSRIQIDTVNVKQTETTSMQTNNANSTKTLATTSPLINNENINTSTTTTVSSPTISRCSSSCSNSSSTSCEITTIVASSKFNNSTTTNTIELDASNNSTSAATCSRTPSPINSSTPTNIVNNRLDSSTTLSASDIKINNSGLITDNPTQPIIMGYNRGSNSNSCCSINSNNNSSSSPQINTISNSATTTPKSARYNKPRLSLSGFTNSSMPSVHGRATTTTNNANNTNGIPPKTRLSTHQRNLSLDFRSMGILLPPVSQVTNTRINLTQHHRNRSLDSALQRIPEVEVSSPNAENENTFCTNSILGSTMCSKIVTSSSTNPQNTPKNCSVDVDTIDSCRTQNQTAKDVTENSASISKVSDNKKREDLTSLGSDDSGIICGSESDQVSLSRIRQSHESLDSGEIDAEEECIEILETTSMDEEYRMLQSDLCFYQTPEKDLCSMKNLRKVSDDQVCDESENDLDTPTAILGHVGYRMENRNITDYKNEKANNIENNKICLPIEIDEDHKKNSDGSADITPTPIDDNAKSIESSVINKTPSSSSSHTKPEIEPKPEHIKNEILFRNFFGATKNAIFRTAQSIIENHEKKNSAKNKTEESAAGNTNQNSAQTSSSSTNATSDLKSPTEISRKKEFFVLKSSLSKNKIGNNVTTSESMPEIEAKQLTKSASGTSLNKLRVPGVVKCFTKEKDQTQQQMKIEKGPSGLLRFFESPVFNIHFAIHYLFYSKEPGVLSFIGNKVFSFPDQEVDLYIPQLIVMYIQMDELAEVLDPYLTYRCRKSVDFSLKCLWLLEAYNYQIDTLSTNKKNHMSLMKELYCKKERKQQQLQQQQQQKAIENEILSPIKKTHHRSQSDATGLLNDSKRFASSGTLSLNSKIYPTTPAKLCLGDLASGKAFDNGCICFESVRGTVNDLLGHKTVCYCGAPKMAPQKEFMKSLINIGKNLTSLQTKAEKTSALRMFLNLINKNLPARVWLPLHSDIPHHVVRITEEKTAVLNSKDKTPYIIYVEVVEVNDIYSSPVILKMMPTLRHTKSEEHLDSKEKNATSAGGTASNSNSSSNLSTKDSGAECNSNCTKDSKISESSSVSENGTRNDLNELHFTEDDVWSQEDDEITAQYLNMHKISERDAISQMSLDSCDSRDQGIPTLFNIGDVRTRHCNNLNCENTKSFSNDPEDPSAAALKEPWHEKEKQIRLSSPYGHLSNWRLLSAIVKCGDDLRQELMATQLLQMFKIIWQEENVDLWVRPYKIVCLSNDSGLIEPILNTVSLHQIKKNSNKSLRDYFIDEYGNVDTIEFKTAQRNFMQSCAAYCLISYLLQVKDRHNGNILLHSDGHLIHIDFGFILSISPKNLGFEQSPFKLTPEFVDVMGGTTSELWTEFNHLLLKGLMAARKHMDRIINLVEIMRSNAQLPCFKNGCSGTVQNLRKRFHMNLTEQELERKVEQLVQDSLKSLSTKLYDGYQYFTNGIL